ncbi:cardiolipin synthase/hydrolase fusion protein [Schizosaccharomyces octosporus yFS286]|uniref:Cardiolipin synthase/hydrolase fusion protein n=1 Tax=Schizosaccharomyces octosporus (strain yFS286) TaxID=483514 RepID=S9Q509_SCHOY|nr:cardiolipin synthase/hydrolase fusion protein [Schizosaccharomyces octosporus yFS286]EPX74723.1 cardiolipin synthase/hydrolase fusion protein [Schizosaccharomyces octosporus yFS286]
MFRVINPRSWQVAAHQAKHHAVRRLTTEVPASGNRIADVAFAFDIDGVLIRGGKGLTEGTKTLRFLQEHKIPFILLTNGGGMHETTRAERLSKLLQISLKEIDFCQSHTPFKNLKDKYKHILVLGGSDDSVRKTAEMYGFPSVINELDVIAKRGAPFWPFTSFTESDLKKARDFDLNQPIEAVFTYVDPVRFGLDLQLVMEMAQSKNGILGTVSETNEEGPDIYFSNADLVWPNEYPLPRLGQGAFASCCEKIYHELTGKQMKFTKYGKPHKITYDYATNILEAKRKALNIPNFPKEIFMVGDNPESDIRGANDYGWTSILVRTGIFQGADNSPKYPAKHVAKNVWEGMRWALSRHVPGSKLDKTMNGIRGFHNSSKPPTVTEKRNEKKGFQLPIRENVFTLPNMLTLSRLFSSPLIAFLYVNDYAKAAACLFMYAGFTDLVDGYLARKFHMRSVAGTVLDPLADKTLMTCLTLCLAYQNSMPALLAGLIIGRDVLLVSMVCFLRYLTLPSPKTLRKYFDFSLPTAELRPTRISKWNTAFQLMLLGLLITEPILPIDIEIAKTPLFFLVGCTTIASGASYILSRNTFRILTSVKK